MEIYLAIFQKNIIKYPPELHTSKQTNVYIQFLIYEYQNLSAWQEIIVIIC